MSHKKVNTGKFVLYGDCPFLVVEIEDIFLCSGFPKLFVKLLDGSIYEQDYYIDVPGIHWFLISDGLTDKGIMVNKIASVRSIFIKNDDGLIQTSDITAHYIRKSG